MTVAFCQAASDLHFLLDSYNINAVIFLIVEASSKQSVFFEALYKFDLT